MGCVVVYGGSWVSWAHNGLNLSQPRVFLFNALGQQHHSAHSPQGYNILNLGCISGLSPFTKLPSNTCSETPVNGATMVSNCRDNP